MVALFENAQGAQVSYKIDDESTETWHPIGELKDDITQTLIVQAKDFVRIKFKLDGNILGNKLIFRGFEILSLNNYDI
jgi:hypothetical protein